jgi:hypothetical protein
MTTNDDSRIDRSRHQAQQTIEAIEALRGHPAFNSYYLRRLNERRLERQQVALSGGTAEEREAARLGFLAYDEMVKMLDVDEVVARGKLSKPRSV